MKLLLALFFSLCAHPVFAETSVEIESTSTDASLTSIDPSLESSDNLMPMQIKTRAMKVLAVALKNIENKKDMDSAKFVNAMIQALHKMKIVFSKECSAYKTVTLYDPNYVKNNYVDLFDHFKVIGTPTITLNYYQVLAMPERSLMNYVLNETFLATGRPYGFSELSAAESVAERIMEYTGVVRPINLNRREAIRYLDTIIAEYRNTSCREAKRHYIDVRNHPYLNGLNLPYISTAWYYSARYVCIVQQKDSSGNQVISLEHSHNSTHSAYLCIRPTHF